jgi:hypothetical protein
VARESNSAWWKARTHGSVTKTSQNGTSQDTAKGVGSSVKLMIEGEGAGPPILEPLTTDERSLI